MTGCRSGPPGRRARRPAPAARGGPGVRPRGRRPGRCPRRRTCRRRCRRSHRRVAVALAGGPTLGGSGRRLVGRGAGEGADSLADGAGHPCSGSTGCRDAGLEAFGGRVRRWLLLTGAVLGGAVEQHRLGLVPVAARATARAGADGPCGPCRCGLQRQPPAGPRRRPPRASPASGRGTRSRHGRAAACRSRRRTSPARRATVRSAAQGHRARSGRGGRCRASCGR